jgi:phage regulator Rha-like protein
MENKLNTTKPQDIENRIFTIRGLQVMLDNHLAELYNVETKVLNQAAKRNIERFPVSFMFQLSEIEWTDLRFQIGSSKNEKVLRSQNVTSSEKEKNLRSQIETSSSEHGGRRYLPYVFTEQGVAMLSAVLRSDTAVKVSIQIIQAFVEMRKFIADKAAIFRRLDKIERKQLEADQKFERVFSALEGGNIKPEKGIFFDGQIFDAYTFIADLVRKARKSIILIDNYIDDTVLTLFSKRKKGVQFTIYTKSINKQLELDLNKHNAQYEPIVINELKQAHDRFLIIDKIELYHIGASLKDLGKKWFAFSKMDNETLSLLKKMDDLK